MMAKVELSDRRAITLIVILLCLIYTLYIFLHKLDSFDFIRGDSYYYRAVIISILEDGDLLLANNITKDPLNGQLALGRDGLAPKHPIMLSLVSLPFYVFWGDYGLLLFNVIDTIILLFLLFKLNRLFFDTYISFIVTILYASGTLFLNYSYNYSPDILSAVLILGGLYAVFRNRFYLGAFLLGLSIFAKVANVAPVGLIGLYLIFAILKESQPAFSPRPNLLWGRGVTLLTAGALFCLALIPLLALNYYLFGSIFVTGYHQTALAGSEPGQILVVDHTDKFNQPLLEGAFQLLFHPEKGLILTNPVIVLAVPGIFLMNRNRNHRLKIYLLLAICGVQFIFFAKYDEWYASHFSNRFLMLLVALSSIFTATFITFIRDKFSQAPLSRQVRGLQPKDETYFPPPEIGGVGGGGASTSPGWLLLIVAAATPFLLGLNLFYVRDDLTIWPWTQTTPSMSYMAESTNELAGLGRLSGYKLSSEITGGAAAQVGGAVEVTIWWRDLGAGGDNLVVRWLDETGFEWGRAKAIPPSEEASIDRQTSSLWGAGRGPLLPDPESMLSTAALTIPPATPPGLYFLRIGLVDSNGTQLLGEFEMPDEVDKLVVTSGQILTDSAQVEPAQWLNERLAPQVTLLGFTPPEQVLTAGAPTWLTLYWQAVTSPPDYGVNLRLLNSAGQEMAHWQGKPGHGRHPTDHWQPGEIVRDIWALQVEPETPPGLYSLEISLIEADHPTHPPEIGGGGGGTGTSARQPATVTLQNLEVWPQPINYEAPDMQATLGADFGERLTLLGYDLYFDTDGSGAGKISPVFHWQSRAEFQEAFDLSLTLRAADTNQIIQEWRLPLGGDAPKALWKSGEIVTTVYQLQVEAGLDGRYHLDVALQNLTTGRTEPVKLANGSEAAFASLENIQDKAVVRLIGQ